MTTAALSLDAQANTIEGAQTASGSRNGNGMIVVECAIVAALLVLALFISVSRVAAM
jgi:hypothetical protein